jgi:hypothetical protein
MATATTKCTWFSNAPQPAQSPVFAVVEYHDGQFGVERDGVSLWEPTNDLERCVAAYTNLVHPCDVFPIPRPTSISLTTAVPFKRTTTALDRDLLYIRR